MVETVFRSLEIKQLKFNRLGRSKDEIMAKINELYGEKLEVTITDQEIVVKGDLHNHRKRKLLIRYLMGS